MNISIDPADGSWVGFTGDRGQSGEGAIVFYFGASETITDVAVNFLRYDALGGVGAVEVPPIVSITEIGGSNNSNNFVPVNFATNDTEGYVHFTGSWTGSELLVTLGPEETSSASSTTFSSIPPASSPTPEPGTVGLGFSPVSRPHSAGAGSGRHAIRPEGALSRYLIDRRHCQPPQSDRIVYPRSRPGRGLVSLRR